MTQRKISNLVTGVAIIGGIVWFLLLMGYIKIPDPYRAILFLAIIGGATLGLILKTDARNPYP